MGLMLLCRTGFADEGMWTFNNFPGEKVQASYGFTPSADWLKQVRLSSVRLGNGCSGSFVSKDGLILTNHHCVHGCVQQLSTKRSDLVENGFFAKRTQDELRCPGLEVSQLVEMHDVTERVQAATKDKTGEAYTDARRAVIADIEQACAKSDKVRCDVVSLYQGGRFELYTYRRYQDVRLVFAPEVGVAFFGGDPDNFNFPRYNLDFGFLRAFDEGQPAPTENYLAWSRAGPEEGALTFVSGHPGSTQRLLTVAQFAYQRDVALPERLMELSELRGRLHEMGRRSKESERIARSALLHAENGFKAFKGRREALVDTAFFSEKAIAEQELQARVKADPKLSAQVGDAWGEIARAMAKGRDMRFELHYQEYHQGYGSKLLNMALTLVRWSAEKTKNNAERLPEYGQARQPALQASLFSTAPVYPELEITMLAFGLERMRRELGPDHTFVKEVLGAESPQSLAERLVKKSRLSKVKVRKQLFEADATTLAASNDPMIQLARILDTYGRAGRKRYETEVVSVVHRASERIAAARFALLGDSVYPDATSSLRLSYGTVSGFPHLGVPVAPFTDFAGMVARATGKPPFALPKVFAREMKAIDKKQRLNFVTTNDIIGGNSGSPVISADRELVGLVFDGNIYSLGGAYGFDARVNRTVAVHSGAIIEALDKVYGAQRLVLELNPK